jgi:predicted PurR-regulated permease PerM
VPAAIVLGIFVGIASIVPYLALIGIPISILLLWLDPPGGFRSEWWWIVGGPPIFYFFAQAFDDYVLTPRIQGKNTGMDAPAVLFASLAGGILAGPYGLLLAIPVAACIKILLVEVFWPRFKAWTEGKATDPLPISDSSKPTSAS